MGKKKQKTILGLTIIVPALWLSVPQSSFSETLLVNAVPLMRINSVLPNIMTHLQSSVFVETGTAKKEWSAVSLVMKAIRTHSGDSLQRRLVGGARGGGGWMDGC